jgi:lambda family phage portal protein
MIRSASSPGIVNRVKGFFAGATRATIDQINAIVNGSGGYDSGKTDRLNRGNMPGRVIENSVPSAQVQNLRWRAWDLHRNNPHARKIVRSLLAKVIGPGLHPLSQAVKADGTPHNEFRERVKKLWASVCPKIDYRGRLGQGGADMVDLQRQALRSLILSGDCLWRYRDVPTVESRRKQLVVPKSLQLIHPERLAEYLTLTRSEADPNNRIFRGIEIDPEGIRKAYWILKTNPVDPYFSYLSAQADRIDIDDIWHLYDSEDIDQLRGVSWFAPVLAQMRDTNDYQYNELKASAIAACVSLLVRRTTGMPAGVVGLNQPDGWPLTDSEGNNITSMQPGLIANLGSDGEVTGFNPARPSTSAEGWINHMLRSTAAGMPGTKSSTVHGDYRNASFSSERAADNDVWPEIEAIQDWFSRGFCQPTYEQILDSAIANGYFAGVMTASEYNSRRSDLIQATWEGPIARSINPKDDADAAYARVKSGQSSPQQETAKVGGDWRTNIRDIAEFIAECQANGIPEELIDSYLGIQAMQKIASDQTPEKDDATDGQTTDAGDANDKTEPQSKYAKPQTATTA